MEKRFDTVKFVRELSEIVTKKIKELEIEHYTEVFARNNPKHAELHKVITEFVAKNFKNIDDFIQKFSFQKMNYELCSNEKHHYSANIIHQYLNDFICSEYFMFKDGKVIQNDKINLDPNQPYLYFRQKYKQNFNGNLPCFIMPDGTTYFSLSLHSSLARWLHASGIDIRNAIRIDHIVDECFGRENEFTISDSNFYNKFDKIQTPLLLTPEQASVIAKIYSTLKDAKHLESIECTLARSSGLGIENNSKIGKKNLYTLDEAFGGKVIDFKNVQILSKQINGNCM